MFRRARVWLTSRSLIARLLIGWVAAVLIIVAGYQTWKAVSADVRVTRAEQAMDKRDFATALDLLDKAQTDRPQSGQLAFLSARAHRRAGQFRVAGQELRRAEQLGWSAEAITFEKALLDAQTVSFRQYEPQLVEYVMADPPRPDAELVVDVLVRGYLAEYEMGRVLEVLAPWVKRRPNDVQYRLWQHEAAARLNSRTISQEALSAAFAIDPENVEVRSKYGLFLLENKQGADAKVHCEWLLARFPRDKNYRIGMAICQRLIGESEAAAKILDELLKDYPDDPRVQMQRGLVELFAARPQSALPWLQKAIERDPFEPQLLTNLAGCLEQLGRSAEAEQLRQRHKKAEDDLEELRLTSRAIQDKPQDADLRYKAADLLARNGQSGEAIRWLESALRVNPQHTSSRRLLSELMTNRASAKP